MKPSPLSTEEEWKAELREFVDKVFKPKKPGMKNLEREILVDFVDRQKSYTRKEALQEALDSLPEGIKLSLKQVTSGNGKEINDRAYGSNQLLKEARANIAALLDKE